MRLTTREKLNGTVDEVHALLIDPAFQEAKCAATTNNGVYTVKVGGGADGHRVLTERQLPSDGLPDMARSFVGDHLTIIEVLDWSGLGPDGVRASMVDIHIKGAPLTSRAPCGSSRTGRDPLAARGRPEGERPAHRRQARAGGGRADQRSHPHRARAAAGVARPLTGWASAHVRVAVVRRRDERLLDRARRRPAQQVLRGAGLVVGARGAAAAERLLADDGAGRLVVDVEVAGGEAQPLGRVGDGGAVLGDDRAGERVRREATPSGRAPCRTGGRGRRAPTGSGRSTRC